MAKQPHLFPFGEFVIWQEKFINFKSGDGEETIIVDCRTPKAAQRTMEGLNQITERRAIAKMKQPFFSTKFN